MRSLRPRGLRSRLLLAFALVAVAGSLTTGALTFREARTGILQQSQDTVVRQFRDGASSRAGMLSVPPSPAALQGYVDDLAEVGRTQGWRVMAVHGEQRVTSRTSDTFPEVTDALRREVDGKAAAVFQRRTLDDRPSLVVGMPLTFAARGGGEKELTGITLFLVVPQSSERAYVDALVSAIERAIVPALLLAVVLALMAARQVLRPVRQLRGAATAMAQGRFDTRLAVNGTDELADLAQTFNETASALDESVSELRRMETRARHFASDVSHELRTPLAAMTAVTGILDEDAGQLTPDTGAAVRLISQETAKLTRLVEDLMEMSRFDANAAVLHRDALDLAECVRATVESRGWSDRVELALPPPGELRGPLDARRLDVVVANLITNALRHGAPPVALTLRPGHRAPGGRWAVIEVADRGPGIPDEALPQLFDRFYKSDSARTRSEGSGLGLAITAENVQLHGGTVRAANREGGGAVFTVSLPLYATVPKPAPPGTAPSGATRERSVDGRR